MATSSPELRRTERRHAPLRRVSLDAAAPQPWRNGGGRTRELLAWPSSEAWRLRISVADIEAGGPFSAFDGVRRWFAVVEGAGIALAFADGERICRRGDAPLAFDGAAAPGCRLLDGPTRDLNLMARGGAAALIGVTPGAGWTAPFAIRGLYTAVPGRWQGNGVAEAVDGGTLLWDDRNANDAADLRDAAPAPVERRAEAWSFVPDRTDAITPAWWLGYTPPQEPGR